MFCKNCGSEINDNAFVCLKCGVKLQDEPIAVNQQHQNDESIEDTASVGYGFLSFFLPVVGLILFLVWRKERPKTAKACIIGTIVSSALIIVAIIAYFCFVASIVGSFTSGLRGLGAFIY